MTETVIGGTVVAPASAPAPASTAAVTIASVPVPATVSPTPTSVESPSKPDNAAEAKAPAAAAEKQADTILGVKEAAPAPTPIGPTYELKYDEKGNLTGIDGLKLPEKYALRRAALEEIAKNAKEHQLDSEQAQLAFESAEAAVLDQQTADKEMLKQSREAWLNQLKSDPELGGTNFPRTMENVRRVMTQYASPKLMKDLNDTGLGNHPELVRFVNAIAKRMGNDTFVAGTRAPAASKKSIEETWYPNMAKK